jgi:hypothetical protein
VLRQFATRASGRNVGSIAGASCQEVEMECFCCRREVPLARKAMARRLLRYRPAFGPGTPNSSEYRAYVDAATYSWQVACPECYALLDGPSGSATIGGTEFSIAAHSRGGRAVTLTAEKYRAWQQRAAARRRP